MDLIDVLCAVGVVALVAAAFAVGWAVCRRGSLRPRSTVVVALRSGRAVSGVLIGSGWRELRLREARVHEPGVEAASPADGEVVIPAVEVEYVQVVG